MSQLIMVAANEPVLLDAYQTFLTFESYYVNTQPLYKKVFAAALELQPNVIILELLMDDDEEALAALELLQAENSPVAHIPVILSSTKNKLTSHLEARLKADTIRLVSKSFDTTKILAEVVSLLDANHLYTDASSISDS